MCNCGVGIHPVPAGGKLSNYSEKISEGMRAVNTSGQVQIC